MVLVRQFCAQFVALLGVAAGSMTPAFAQEEGFPGLSPRGDTDAVKTSVRAPGYSPYAGRNFPTQVYWGDTHVHTDNSLDANGFGARIGPEEAFRFARGEEVISSTGQPFKLSRPLDWLVVADHSDGMGAMKEIRKGNPRLLADPTVRDWYNSFKEGGDAAFTATMDVINAFSQGTTPEVVLDRDFQQTVWDDYIDTAERFNEPGRFTAMLGYEWTSTEDGINLHRNVLYRDDGDVARRMVPYTTAESFNPEDLWKWMASYEESNRRQGAGAGPQRQHVERHHVPGRDQPGHRQEAETTTTLRSVPAGNRCTRSRRSRATARRIPCCRRTTSLRTSRPWRSAT